MFKTRNRRTAWFAMVLLVFAVWRNSHLHPQSGHVSSVQTGVPINMSIGLCTLGYVTAGT